MVRGANRTPAYRASIADYAANMSMLPPPRQQSHLFGRAEIRELLVAELATKLGCKPMSIDPSKNFDEYGLDSIDAVLATGTLSDRLKIVLPPEFLLLYRTIDEAVEHILEIGSPSERQ